MGDKAREKLIRCVLDQLRGTLADKNCTEYLAIDKHRNHSKFSFIFSYTSSQWGKAFALVTLDDQLIKNVQKSQMEQNETKLNLLLEKVRKYVVFRAVQRDEGETFLWEIDPEVVEETYF